MEQSLIFHRIIQICAAQFTDLTRVLLTIGRASGKVNRDDEGLTGGPGTQHKRAALGVILTRRLALKVFELVNPANHLGRADDQCVDSRGPTPLQPLEAKYLEYQRKYQQLVDRTTPHMLYRWLSTGGLVVLFLLRIVFAQGVSVTCSLSYVKKAVNRWHLTAHSVCYAHAIYLLNLLLAFLQPKFDPSLAQDLRADEIEEGGEPEGELINKIPDTTHFIGVLASTYENAYDGGGRRTGKDEEFRPFIRRLPEWQFWLSATRATVFAILATLFEAFDVPVYWPILVIYFFILFGITMKRQIRHMIKYKYVPFDIGRKATYGAK
ncbi:Rer1 domain-containing protein [Rhizoctonia solani AG-1 IA]|uniref:Rer1 domain-containing protein n=1 Tax=Thanatephorus cucumeris (strain AG1-IA) TaxID=983506 RepID=L8WVE8_THACA|nr:Rer1 domain-containing protein [Rhizoctonia solani AG-1 IA]